MNAKKSLIIMILALSLIICQAELSEAAPMKGGFTYQGRLIDGEDAADGLYDLQFKLFDVNTAGDQLGDDVNKPDVDIIDGYFTVELDFNDASAFDGSSRWLEIGVRPGELSDPNAYTTLGPRQEITAAPYALQTRGIYVGDTGNVGIGTTNPDTKLEVVGGILAGNDGYALSDQFDYGEDQSSHSYECTGECYPGPDFYSCGKDDTLRIGSCSTGTGSVSIIVSVIPDVSHIKLRYRAPWDGGSSGTTLYVDGVNKGQIHENGCNWQEMIVTDIAAYTADGQVEIQISDEILGCDGDLQITYLEVYSPINLALDVKGDANITEDLTVAGNVGIGTTSPETNLHIYDGECGGSSPNPTHDPLAIETSGNAYINLLTPSDRYAGLLFSDDFRNQGLIRYSHVDDEMDFWTNGSFSAAIDSSGRFGIGTENPYSDLHIYDDTGDTSLTIESDAGDAILNLNRPHPSSTYSNSIRFTDDGAVYWMIGENDGSHDLLFSYTSEGEDRLLLSSGGDVGVGTLAPAEKLHVNGKVKTDEVVYTSPRSHYCAISGDEFLPRTNSGSTYRRAYGNSGAYMYSGSENMMTAQAHLPDGASVTEFKVFFYDNHIYNLSADLLKNWFSSGYTTMAEVDSSGISEYGNKIDTSITIPTVNLSTGTYDVHVSATDWSSAGSDLRIMGALITYTITEAP